jgi:hypothetical protein
MQQFANETNPWFVAGSAHGLGVNVEAFVQLDGGTKWSRLSPASIEINKTTGDVTVGWAKPTAGRILISRLQGYVISGSGGGTANHSLLQNLDYSTAGHTGFESEDHAAEHKHNGGDEVGTATAAANAIPKADASGRLAPAWLPDLSAMYQAVSGKGQANGYAGLDSASKVNRSQLPTMTGDAGSGGQTGSVPAPAAGDLGKCLKGNATWGDCGSGGGTPGGSNGQLQFNNAGTFSGVSGTSISGNSVSVAGKIDAGSGTLEIPNGPSLPESCVTGEVFLLSSTTSGQKLYACEAPNTWIPEGDGNDGGGAGGGGAPATADYIVWSTNSTLTNEHIAKPGAGIVITKETPIVRWDLDCSYAGCQGDDNNFSGNNQLGLGTKYLDFSIPNNSTTGTTANKLVSWSGDPVRAVSASTSSTNLLGVCVGGCGTTGTPRIAIRGRALCVFDSAPSAGNYVVASSVTPGNCQDAGTTRPTSGLVGVAYSSVSQAGAYEVILMF